MEWRSAKDSELAPRSAWSRNLEAAAREGRRHKAVGRQPREDEPMRQSREHLVCPTVVEVDSCVSLNQERLQRSIPSRKS